MPDTPSTIIVGSGVVGVTAAYFLASRGRQVLVLDREANVADAASHGNGGMLTPSLVDPWNAPGVFRQLLQWLGDEHAPLLLRPHVLPRLLGWGIEFLRNSDPERFRANMSKNLRLSAYSVEVMRRLRDELKLSYDQNLDGSLKVFRDAGAFEEAAARSELLSQFGIPLRRLEGREVLEVEPALDASALVGGIHCPGDETGDSKTFAQALAREAGRMGARFRLGEQVTGFQRAGGRITAVRTNRGVYPAREVIISAGAWSQRLAALAGVRVRIQPVKGYSITFDARSWRGRPRLPVVDDALHAAVSPLGSRIRVAGTAELTGFDARLSPGRIENLKSLLTAMYPSAAEHVAHTPVSPWAGFRPVTPDGAPVIGQAGPENLYLNTGHGHLGWTMAAGSARLLADMVSGAEPEIDPRPFSLRRPRHG